MRYTLTEDQSLMVDQVNEFAKGHLGPLVDGWKQQEETAHEGLQAIAEQGLLGCCIPEADGGAGLDPFTLCHSIRAIARVDASLATLVALTNGLVAEYLIHFDKSPQRSARLEALITGESSVAWLAPTYSTKPPFPNVTAEPIESGWKLNGEVQFVSQGATAHNLLAFATTPDGHLQAFWMKATAPGVERQIVRGKLGLRHTELAHIRLHGLELPTSAMLHPDSFADDPLKRVWCTGRTALAAVCLGNAEASLREATQYAQQRKQFGKPIAAFQAIQWKVANAGMAIETAKLFVDRAVSYWDGEDLTELERWSHMAFSRASQAAVHTGAEAIQIHGGYGFTQEYPVEKLYRDAQTLRARWHNEGEAQTVAAEPGWHLSL
ncbi:MAG: hypothetical protein EP343_10180 [Deltaproteobacteria bacterium]|nr:MAG: hypothetical protein EP343_10180 [Deltaproteobacteria bacterium]